MEKNKLVLLSDRHVKARDICHCSQAIQGNEYYCKLDIDKLGRVALFQTLNPHTDSDPSHSHPGLCIPYAKGHAHYTNYNSLLGSAAIGISPGSSSNT